MQWGLIGVKTDEVRGKTLSLGLQVMPYNRWEEATLAPRIAQRIRSGGTMITDGWKAYPGSAQAAKCNNKMVNH